MSEYIKREDVEKAIADIRGIYRKSRNFNAVSAIDNAAGEIRECVKNADVAPVVHACWKRVDKDDGGHDTVCSHCSTPIVTYLETPYCHNCGAKMDKEGC